MHKEVWKKHSLAGVNTQLVWKALGQLRREDMINAHVPFWMMNVHQKCKKKTNMLFSSIFYLFLFTECPPFELMLLKQCIENSLYIWHMYVEISNMSYQQFDE